MTLDATTYSLDINSHVPKYLQLKDILIDMASKMKPREMLPSENMLAKQFHVHRLTSRQAVTELVKEGILYREHGKGTFVSEPKAGQEKAASNNIACLFRRLRPKTDWDNFFLEIFEALEDEISQNNKFMLYKSLVSLNSYTGISSEEEEEIYSNAKELLKNNVSGIIFDERISDTVIEKLLPCKKALAVVNRKSSLEGVLSAIPDVKAYMHRILDYLTALGHSRILYIYDILKTNQVEMLETLENDCEKFGIARSNILALPCHEKDDSGNSYRSATENGVKSIKPTAIIAGFDWIASNVYRKVKEMGFKIPEDISVISVGDLAIASQMTPPLTTLKLDTEALGKAAAKLIINGCKENILIEPKLIERESCAKI